MKKDIEEMKDLREQGLTYAKIGEKFGISRQLVWANVNNYKNTTNKPKAIKRRYEEVLLRDNYSCQWKEVCKGSKKLISELSVHHKDLNRDNDSKDNLITLCKSCHSYFHSINRVG